MRAPRRSPEWLQVAATRARSLVCEPGCRYGAVEGGRAKFEHLHLEHCAALPYLLAARFAPAWRMNHVVRDEPVLLRPFIDLEQEYPVEEIEKLVKVPRDATDEGCSVMPGQGFLHPGSAPHPAMRPEPLFVGAPWSLDWVAIRVFPMRKLAVIVRSIARRSRAEPAHQRGLTFPIRGYP